MRIGIDLDNTLIHYDDAFVKGAIERELLPESFRGTKQQVRDTLRAKGDEGEIEWQKLQGYVYGSGIRHARLFEGADSFLRRAREAGAEIAIVSHKTEFGHYDPERVNLRDAARSWLDKHGFFAGDGYGLASESLFFESTRMEKIQRIAMLGFDWFIDDLVEVFEEPGFPAGIKKLLFSTLPAHMPPGDWVVCCHWSEIERHVFGHTENRRHA